MTCTACNKETQNYYVIEARPEEYILCRKCKLEN